ncbi:MAG: putative short-subunit dehydrogenase-like oxidoreductase (DUF2520 family) [Salibacteraceae bacterium]|jgi:predicted short-subunit dehydrogenase-like oxidoreductase (DUF2520 family)
MKNVSIIGSGNVASHLATALFKAGINIVEVHSQTFGNAKELAKKVDAKAINDIEKLDVDTPDIIILSVNDDRIKEISESILKTNSIVVHTSGTRSMDMLDSHINRGVFYPLQTFSKSQPLNFKEVPICIESNTEKSLKKMETLALKLSADVRETNAQVRKDIHIAAVIACNFSNHMYALAADILEKSGEDFSILKPLVLETVKKAFEMPPKEAQTGPAVREDMNILDEHLNRLNDDLKVQSLYKEISNSIISLKNE